MVYAAFFVIGTHLIDIIFLLVISSDQPNDHQLKAVELSVREIVQPPYASERFLRGTFRVFELLRAAEDSEVVRAGFMAAARAFVNAG